MLMQEKAARRNRHRIGSSVPLGGGESAIGRQRILGVTGRGYERRSYLA
jgi:hypothetical protein